MATSNQGELQWQVERPEDRARWWVRDSLYTAIPRTPLSDSVITPEWDEAVLCIADELSFPDSRGFNARTVNGYTYLSPMKIADHSVIEARLPKFFAKMDSLIDNVQKNLATYAAEQDADWAFWSKINLNEVTNPMTLLEYWRRALFSLDRAWKLHFLIVFPRHVVSGMLDHSARDLAGLTQAYEVGSLTAAHGHTRQMDLDQALWGLAAAAIDAGLKATFVDTADADLIKALQASSAGKEWYKKLEGFLSRFGHRTTVPFEFSEPSWFENPLPVLGTIRAYVAQGGHYDFAATLKQMEKERDTAVAAAMAKISDADARAKFERIVIAARRFQAAMEDDNFPFLRANVYMRYVALAMGGYLHKMGALDDANDVVFLRREQLEKAMVDAASGVYKLDGFKTIAANAKAQWQQWRDATPKDYLGDFPEEIDDFMLTQFWGVRGRKYLDDKTGVIQGLGASVGVVEGVARVVLGPSEFGKVQPGEIVICRSTNPAWTPVFTKIAGIVTDQGGTLSHAAVVAREYGIPAVLGTLHGTKRITTGKRVRINGSTGKVEIL